MPCRGGQTPAERFPMHQTGEEKKPHGPQLKYMAQNIRRFQLAVNRGTEADLLTHLERQPNIQGYLKALIRADMATQKKAGE